MVRLVGLARFEGISGGISLVAEGVGGDVAVEAAAVDDVAGGDVDLGRKRNCVGRCRGETRRGSSHPPQACTVSQHSPPDPLHELRGPGHGSERPPHACAGPARGSDRPLHDVHWSAA
jgi:hypothetical protein